MPTYKVMIAQFPGNNVTHPDVSDWVAETLVKMRLDPRIGAGNAFLWRKADTPITMSRNRCLLAAERAGIDYVVMIDNDMNPDLPLPGAKPFWDTAWEWVLDPAQDHKGRPCAVAAPYCGPPPLEAAYVFKFVGFESNNPNANFQIKAYTRDEAAAARGFVRVSAAATGLMLVDMRAVKKLPHPRFDYEWEGEPRCEHCGHFIPGERVSKASTEDVKFFRDLTYAGVPIYCAFDSWAGHWKPKCVGRPFPVPVDAVPVMLRDRAKQIVARQMGTAAADGECDVAPEVLSG